MASETMKTWSAQRVIEEQFNRKLIDKKLHELLITKYSTYVDKGEQLLKEWIKGTYYESKNNRLKQLALLDIRELTEKVLVGTFYCQTEELFTSVSAQIAGVLGFCDKPDAIKTAAEILAVLCYTDAFDIRRNDVNSMVMISKLKISSELQTFIANTMFMPPMVCSPLEVTSNMDSGYLTLRSSMVLGKGNYHCDDIGLDAINTANSVELSLNTQFLSYLEMNPSFTFESKEQEIQWNNFKKDSYKLMVLLAKNESFWFTHAYDKRGRMYSRGYMVNTQGAPFQKACIDFAQKESIDVPAEYRS